MPSTNIQYYKIMLKIYVLGGPVGVYAYGCFLNDLPHLGVITSSRRIPIGFRQIALAKVVPLSLLTENNELSYVTIGSTS